MAKKKKKKPDYEEKKAIVTEFEGVKFALVLPDIEKLTEVEGSLGKMGIGGKREIKKSVIATVVDDPRLPTNGPVPHSVWVEYWRYFIEKRPLYQKHLAQTATAASGVMIKPDNVDLSGTIRMDSVPISWTQETKCPNCNIIIDVDQYTRYCPKCGYELKQINV